MTQPASISPLRYEPVATNRDTGEQAKSGARSLSQFINITLSGLRGIVSATLHNICGLGQAPIAANLRIGGGLLENEFNRIR